MTDTGTYGPERPVFDNRGYLIRGSVTNDCAAAIAAFRQAEHARAKAGQADARLRRILAAVPETELAAYAEATELIRADLDAQAQAAAERREAGRAFQAAAREATRDA